MGRREMRATFFSRGNMKERDKLLVPNLDGMGLLIKVEYTDMD